MSRDISSNRPIHSLANENEFESPLNQIPLALSRPPLNSIPDPSQYQSKTPENDTKEKSQSSNRLASSFPKSPSSRIQSRGKSGYSEAFSAQTSSRSSSRLSNVGAGFNSTSLVRLPLGGRFGVLPRVSRGVSVAVPQKLLVDVPYFELDEDPSFWKDHNVQVLIRIRPLNDDEMMCQGYGRCLRQETAHTLAWLGNPETRFTFDHIACESTSQERLFRVAGLPMVDNCMSGYNSCMFAYGQTGSGKTYTMMGEVDKMDGGLSDDCGITPRIFEYLFTRIREEEESRKNERLTYSCKCSFLEIYNEHITDLLEPLSTNLQLREDLKKGVHVENLTEHSVRTVDDVLKLLQQGTANRKIAATYMNSESSRSHSVFTCIIESRWDKDSMSHLRFGRLNLVDLAGSERQKSSGAEGDRLKEAANINKSLSTLGLVIMSLVDLAQGKHRHVPYRDSRLTFLLQDSLGGNSKTTIIANVSPSARSVNETLSTLKFAQRAKLIQNNAKINEDASGDVIVLQQKIQHLEGLLSFFMEHQPPSIEQLDFAASPNQFSSLGNHPQRHQSYVEVNMENAHKAPTEENMKINDFKATLCGSLRREKLAEIEVRRLKADIEQLNSLAHQREEEANNNKMMLRFSEDKIRRLELLSDGLSSADKFYQDENSALREEILRLHDKIARNPEVIRLASENQRLQHQIRLYQNSGEEVDSETMLAEILQLRNQLSKLLGLENSNAHHQISHLKLKQEFEVAKELGYCKDMNSNLIREVDELRQELGKALNFDQDTRISVGEAFPKCEDDVIHDKNDKQKPMNFHSDKREDNLDLHFDNVYQQLKDAESLIAVMKLEHLQLIKERESTQLENQHLTKMLNSEEYLQFKVKNNDHEQIDCRNPDPTKIFEVNETASLMTLQAKLDKLSCDLKEAEILNRQYTEDQSRLISQDHQIESIRDEVELETTKTIIHLQDEIDRLESEFQVRLCSLDEQNASLRKNLAVKEDELKMFCTEWERATLELTTFLIDGSKSLGDASTQIRSISSSFAGVNDWVSEHVEKAAKICIEKDETILLLQKSLEDAQTIVIAMEQKIYSLKGATIALTGFPHLENLTYTENDLRSNPQSLQASDNIMSSCNAVQQENESQFSPQTKFELVQLCKKLGSMNACFGNASSTHCHPDSATTEGSTSDYSSSCFSSSEESAAYAEKSVESLCTSNNLKHQGNIRDYQSTIQSVELCERNLEKLAVEGKQCSPVDFFAKFEETLTTIKEADQMLNTMLKANETASMSTAMWKQEGKKLMEIKASLSEEIKQLKSSIRLRNTEKEEWQDQMQFTSTQIVNILSLLEFFSLQMRTGVENFLEAAHMDAVEESQAAFSGLWSSLEDLMLREVQNGICIFVLQCQMREYFHELGMLDRMIISEESEFQEPLLNIGGPGLNHECGNKIAALQDMNFEREGDHMYMSRMKREELDLVDVENVNNNSELKKQLQRKDTLLKGLLFDFSLLQELASNRKDVKDEFEKLILALNNLQHELQIKTVQLDDMVIRNTNLEGLLAEAELALFNSKAELHQAKEKLSVYSEQKIDLTDLVKDLFLKNSEAEQLLEEQKETIRSLEGEIIRISPSPEEQVSSSMEHIEGALALATAERDELVQKLASLQDRLDMACALADENQSRAAEARHESEASKLFAEQKEEEVKILENSIEELECTINVLERKVDEMEHEVEKHRVKRESLEFELQELRHRLFVEDFTDSMTSGNSTPGLPEDQLLRKLRIKCSEVNEAYGRIHSLEEENAKQSKEIKLFKDYISELVLHAEAQASQYQQQYKNLEAMLHEVKADLSNVAASSSSDRDDKTSTRPRGSNSPFKCISGLVQQRNQEKDHELSIAKLRMQELESLAASRQKQVCILQTKLASTESMTHDVIRDLLSVKLDMLNCADILDQQELEKLIEDAQHHRQEYAAMEEEIGNLRSHIEDLVNERNRYFSEINESKEQQLACEIMLEQLQERDQLLLAQNDMLQTDKSKLQKRVVELDHMMKKLFKMQETQSHDQPEPSTNSSRSSNTNVVKSMVPSQKMLPRINNNFVQYRNSHGEKSGMHHETKFR